jgi:hypothetical protein
MAVNGSFYPAKQLAPNVWVGSRADAHDVAFMRRANIRHVINCTKDVAFKFPRLNGFRIPVDDDFGENATMARHLPIAVSVIESATSFGNEGVLVHCVAGMQRSATVVCALLMKRNGWAPSQAMRYMQSIKKETFRPYPTFSRALDTYFTSLSKT